MKKINFLALSIVFTGLLALTSCKKETRIEKNLWKNGGEWNVTSWKGTIDGTQSEYVGADIQSAVFTFTKEKEVTLVITGDAGDIYTYKMKYDNTESQLTFTNVTDQATGLIDFPSMINYIMWEKDLLDLKTTTGFTGADTETLILKKM
jgi:hypothetical protein